VRRKNVLKPKLTKLELQIDGRATFFLLFRWKRGVHEGGDQKGGFFSHAPPGWTGGKRGKNSFQETFPEKGRPAYTTIQTTVYRLEAKKAVRRVKKVGNFHIFEAAVSRNAGAAEVDRRPPSSVRRLHPARNGTPD